MLIFSKTYETFEEIPPPIIDYVHKLFDISIVTKTFDENPLPLLIMCSQTVCALHLMGRV